jgi:hypothetical protein
LNQDSFVDITYYMRFSIYHIESDKDKSNSGNGTDGNITAASQAISINLAFIKSGRQTRQVPVLDGQGRGRGVSYGNCSYSAAAAQQQ